MDEIQASGVKIPNSLLVSSLTDSETDEELYDFLKQYGSIQRIIPVDLPQYGSDRQMIVEFAYGTAVQSLLDMLPYKLVSKTKTDISFDIKALAGVYISTVGQSTTQMYIEELKKIAKHSGKDLTDVLRRELHHISETVKQEDRESQQEDSETNFDEDLDSVTQVSRQPSGLPPQSVHIPEPRSASYQQPTKERTRPTLTFTDLYPSDQQKIVVEHIVKHEDSTAQMHASLRLRPFSGRCPRPNNEVDYETWRSNAEFLLNDSQQSDLHKSRRILESLLSPAVDIVKNLTPNSSPSMYLNILDSAFGTVEDGDDLYAMFLSTLQNNGEKSSAYLLRLQVMLNTTLRRGGVKAIDLDSQLLKQFCRGCWDNALLSELKLEQKKQTPPTFAELLLLLRTGEDKRNSKECRMKQYFGVSKQKVTSQFQAASSECTGECNALLQRRNESRSEIDDLKKQIAKLQFQLSRLSLKDDKTSSNKAHPRTTTNGTKQKQILPSNPHNNNNNHSKQPRPWYCFRCGEDGHIKPQCEGEPNPSLVAFKRKLLREKQMEWEMRNGHLPSDHLN